MVDHETRAVVEDVLRKALGRYDYERSEVEARRDQDDEPALYITAQFAQPSTIPVSLDTTKAMVALRRALLERGDGRFPYLDYVYPRESADEAA